MKGLLYKIYDKLVEVYQPLLRLPYGDKLAHATLGILALPTYLIDDTLLSISAVSYIIGLGIEAIQVKFMDKPFSHLDALAVWTGGTILALLLLAIGIITLS